MDREIAPKVYVVPHELVADIWPTVAEYAAKALRPHPFLEASDLLVLLLQGGVRLFVATDGRGVMGFAAAELVDYPRLRAVNLVAAGGRRGFLRILTGPMLEVIEAWGRSLEATVFTSQGRAGWVRIAHSKGGQGTFVSLIWREIGAHDVRRRQEADDDRSPRPVGPGASLPH